MKEHVIVITGATGVLAGTAARAFAAEGASLGLLSNDAEKLDALTRSLALTPERILAQTADLTDSLTARDSALGLIRHFGRIDALLHLIGGWAGGQTLVETGPDVFEAMLTQHARTTFHTLQAFVPALVENGRGRVIAVSSPLAVRPAAKSGVYAAAKATQETMILALAEELRGTGVTANIIHVKSIDVENKGTGTAPDEIVAAMRYLLSDEAAKVNGARIPVYG
jgi:NAD(P)-dependent dehydrogenase (short-subunit alcohol dehydrogenase family)